MKFWIRTRCNSTKCNSIRCTNFNIISICIKVATQLRIVSETKSVLIPVRLLPSTAGNDDGNLTSGIVPDARLLAFKLVRLAPLPLKVLPVTVPEEVIAPEEVIVPVVFTFPVPVISLEFSRFPQVETKHLLTTLISLYSVHQFLHYSPFLTPMLSQTPILVDLFLPLRIHPMQFFLHYI